MLKRGISIAALLVCAWAGRAEAAITISESPFDVGSVLIGGTTMDTATLTTDGGNLQVDVIVTNNCTGGGGTFTVLTPNLFLKPSDTVTISYTPSARGLRSCQVRVTEQNNPMNVLFTFSVHGTGLAPASMTLSGNTDFGSVRHYDLALAPTSSRTITVQNGGDVALNVSDVAIGGTSSGDYSITSGGTSMTVPALSSRSWNIGFNPSAAGTRAATLTFTSDAATNGTQTLNLTGVGTNATIGVATADPSFGIVATGSSASKDITVSNDGLAPKGPLGVTRAEITGGTWFTFAGCGGGTVCNYTTPLSIATSTIVGVRCSPPDTATSGQMQTATVTFTSDSDPSAMPDNSIMLTCEAGKSDVAMGMSTVTFGPQLVQTTSAPLTVTVKNNGNLTANYTLVKVGGNAGAFTVTGCGAGSNCALNAGQMTSFTVTFTPPIEGDVTASVIAFMGVTVANPSVTCSGRGVDKHIRTTDAILFPDTYRNPGTKATLMPLVVENTGEYPLTISDIQIGGAGDIWTLADPFAPFDVPGLDSKNVMLRFAPEATGKAPDATVVVFSNDTAKPTQTIVLSGNGKDRNIAMGPGAIEFGNTGAGIPINLAAIKTPDELLTISNMDIESFKITGFKYVDSTTNAESTVYEVRGLGGGSVSGMDLAVGATEKFDIVFKPPVVGDFNGQLTLFLDDAKLGERTIEVRGRALFVEAHGGGGFGCSTGSGAGGGVLLALLALRRRRRA